MPEATAPAATPPPPRSRLHPRPLVHRSFLFAGIAALVLGAASCSGDEAADSAANAGGGADDPAEVETYSGYVVDPPNEVAGVTMPVVEPPGAAGSSGASASGIPEPEMVDFSAAPGGLNLVYFGYTFCPDVCPTTMSDVRRVLAALPAEEAERIGVAMATIDPNRDTPEVLTEYVRNFVDDGVALRTEDDDQLRAVTDAFGANYEVSTNDEGDIEVSHTGELYAVDDSGTVVMAWPFGTSHESITRDVRSLLAQAESSA